MIGRTSAYFAAIFAVSVSTQAVAEAVAGNQCWRTDESAAAQVQTIQTMLMVQALKCQDTLPATVDGYNGFLRSKRELLVASKHVVEGHFVRQMGSDTGVTAATNYQTHLGNRTSAPGIDPEQCRVAGAYARMAATASDEDLMVLAKLIAPAETMEACSGPAASTVPAAMVVQVWERPVPIVAAAAAPAAILFVAAPPAPVMTPAAAVAAGPVATLSADGKADQVKALQAAVIALTQAAAALQSPPAGSGAVNR